MCSYCGVPGSTPELEAAEVLALIDHLAGLGCTRINFGGAEPLERRELPAFLARCREHRIWTVVETNGHALPDRIDELGPVSRFMISLDGDQATHDRQREIGSFRAATAGIRAARAAGASVGSVTVLTRHNVSAEAGEPFDQLDAVLRLAGQLGFVATFTPLAARGPGATRAARRLLADEGAMRNALLWLLEARAAGRPVGMSEKTLRYLLEWGDYGTPWSGEVHDDLVCMAGQVSCAIDADGSVYPCTPRLGDGPAPSVRDVGFAAAFDRLADNACRACSSTSCTEANFLYNLDRPVILEIARGGLRAAAASARIPQTSLAGGLA
jgi:MoaA/NifB/PqqE/SkfB family radical SAM enzyme